jgi:hypothetical protein
MKFIRPLRILIPLFFIMGCYLEIPEKITGNGNVITEERRVSDFNKINVGSGIDVYMTQGDNISVEVEADENLMDVIKTEVKDNKLKVYTTKNISMAKSKKVYLTYIDLDRIEVSSAGDVKGENTLIADELYIRLSSAGDLKLDVVAKEININISSSGNATLSGKTDVLKAGLSSAGDLNAFDLEAKYGDVDVSSAGDAKVFITEEASFNSSSAGDIIYKGDPKINRISTSSAGSVKRK